MTAADTTQDTGRMQHAEAPRAEGPLSYPELLARWRALVAGERDRVATLANTAALLFEALPELNWAGFYLLRQEGGADTLVLGPFQGRPACVRIGVGQGVCGTAVARRASVLVEDVHAFPGHIACDAASRSELVVPLLGEERVLGVLDLDSPRVGRFRTSDRLALEVLAAELVAACDWPD